MKDAVPFVLAVGFVLLQPALDRPWRKAYRDQVKDPTLWGVGSWVADTASFLPSSLLSLFGLFQLLPERTSDVWGYFGLLVGAGAFFVIYLVAADRKGPGKKIPRRTWYSALQYLLIALNIAGIVLTFVLNHTDVGREWQGPNTGPTGKGTPTSAP